MRVCTHTAHIRLKRSMDDVDMPPAVDIYIARYIHRLQSPYGCMVLIELLIAATTAPAVDDAEAEVEPGKMGPVLCSSTESLSVADLRIA